MKPTALVFGFLCCLYALTGGGQGYSVDGTFSYEVARSVVTDPARDFLARNRETLKRWGPVAPALGVPFAWLGARLGEWAPRRDTVRVDGRTRRLYDWPAIGAPGADAQGELRIPLPGATTVSQVRLVSFLSLASGLEDGAPVAEILLRGESGGDVVVGRATLRAGVETAEWAYDLPAAERPRHRRARVVGHWPGNPAANLYAATVAIEPVAGGGAATSLAVRYVAPAGRLHLRSIVLESVVEPPGTAGIRGTPGVEVALPGPPAWSAEEQAALFTRFGFSFLNAPLMALTGALLVPLASLLGYTSRAGIVLAVGYGVGTLAWPFAKHDFSEPAAGVFALASTVLVFVAVRRRRRLGEHLSVAVVAGGLAAMAAGAKYTAAWFIPLLAVQLALLWVGGRPHPLTPSPTRRGGIYPATASGLPRSPLRRGEGLGVRSLLLCLAAFLAVPGAAATGTARNAARQSSRELTPSPSPRRRGDRGKPLAVAG
ncbi:MAG: hypothetical protein ACRDJN_00920 [Chloroflexota bacterium]